MTEDEADFVVILSSELIAEVMEDYFNKKMYKFKVKVIDLQAGESGYAFNLAKVKEERDIVLPSVKESIWLTQEDVELVSQPNVEYDVKVAYKPSCIHGLTLGNDCPHCQRDKVLENMTPIRVGNRDKKGKFIKKV